MIHFGIIREGKVPPDERVPLVPSQIAELIKAHPNQVRFSVQSSPVRRITDTEFSAVGLAVVDDISVAEVLIGVKEVPIDQLIAGKTYLFFSHTIKKQPYNKKLLKAVLEKRITLIDWECLRDARGRRLIGFGRYAGIVGTYNGFRAWGQVTGGFQIKQAKACEDRVELEQQLNHVRLTNEKILLTGRGKVAKGAMEVLNAMGVKKVGVKPFLNESFNEPVYVQVEFNEYFKHREGKPFDVKEFYALGAERYRSDFMRFANVSDIYIAGHYWDSKSPYLFTREDVRKSEFRIKLVADISCDVDGPVATTVRASTIEAPFYGYDPVAECEVPFLTAGSVAVMAVDNLPCELPRDASREFGSMFTHAVLPSFLNGDKHGILSKATIAKDGELTAPYVYLKDWVNS